MKKLNKTAGIILAVISLSFLSGCAGLTNPTRLHRLDGGVSHVVDFDASRRGAYVINKNDNVGICAEPAPDVSIEFVSKIMGEVKGANANLDAKAQAELQSRVIQLAGRSQMLLALRESLYRLCEQGLNGNLSPDQVKELYAIALETALKLAEKDVLEEQKEIIRGLENPAVRRAFEGIIDK